MAGVRGSQHINDFCGDGCNALSLASKGLARAAPGPGNQLLVNSERYVAARSASVPSASSGQLHWALHNNLPRWPMTPTRFRLDEGFEYGDAATTSRKSLAARRAVDAGKWRPAARKAPRQRNAAPEYIVVSKQLLESKPTVPTVKRVPVRSSGDSFADDDLTHTSSVTDRSRQSCRPLTSPVQTWRLRDRTPPATALMPRWAAKERRAATTSGGRPKGGKAADDDVPESLAYLPARLPTDRYFDAASRLEDPTSPYYWTGQLSSPAARVFLTPTILHVGRRHALRRTTINARSRIY